MGIGWLTFYYINKILSRFRLFRGSGDVGTSSEEAGKLLLQYGFKILERRPKGTLITYINGRPNLGIIQADFAVSKKGKTYIAAIKSGEFTQAESDLSLRRQLIEYNYVYKPDALLIIDMNEGKVKHVEFGLPEQKRERFILFVVGIIIVSILAGLIFIYIQAKLF